MRTDEKLRHAQELLGRVRGLKNYIRHMRSDRAIDNDEFIVLMRSANELEVNSLRLASQREAQHAKNGIFHEGLPRPEFEIKKCINRE